ncbi:cysteine desulfuration protein SufE [Methanohalophilus levihalophilus]|uniref:SufE family protein n=1 Tax=Methanohalophilus levihalophilus TaxID=1431282 RepID=UPI001AEB82B1|nr:SufE family protein [Methanohalophilus levihalophilus]MBP2030692.1 cysteine desulfuration protein SufE [Methanohalophilus levihalophilus]
MRDAIQDEIIKEFDGLEWFDKYGLLISFGKVLEPMDAEFKTEENAISGCQSKVWINSLVNDGKLVFSLDSDAMITKGIISLLMKVINNRSPQEILDLDLYFIDDIGLKSNLSPARSNGLASIISRIREIAKEKAD